MVKFRRIQATAATAIGLFILRGVTTSVKAVPQDLEPNTYFGGEDDIYNTDDSDIYTTWSKIYTNNK